MSPDRQNRAAETATLLRNRLSRLDEDRLAGAARLLCLIAGVLSALALLHLLYSAWCAFTWGKYTLSDYGKYVNMIWNGGHGAPFRMLVNGNYLATHLSFTLALLGPLFRAWDHPFLLAVVQWLALLAGCVCLLGAARARGLSPELGAALLFFFCACPPMQSGMLSEFHGVSLYVVLIPCLHLCALRQRRWVWLPLTLILGVREEAGLVVIPLLLYLAVHERWKAGYLYAAIAALYVALATQVLFPWLSGLALAERRGGMGAAHILAQLREVDWRLRLVPVLWLLLPALPFLRRGWRPILVIPSVAVLSAALSPYRAQYLLRVHYVTPALVCLAAALVEAAARSAPRREEARARLRSVGAAGALVALTLAAHLHHGFLALGGCRERVYLHRNPEQGRAITAAARIPRRGVLLTSWRLAGYAANRADILTWQQLEDYAAIDLMFIAMKDTTGARGREIVSRLENGEFGVRFFDGEFAVLERGYPTPENAAFLQAREQARRTIRISNTLKTAGRDSRAPGCLSARFWNGRVTGEPPQLAFGRSISLAPGRYEARLRFRCEPPKNSPPGVAAGRWTLCAAGTDTVLAEAAIPAHTGDFTFTALSFTLTQPTDVEPRIHGASLPLWLDRVVFFPLTEPE